MGLVFVPSSPPRVTNSNRSGSTPPSPTIAVDRVGQVPAEEPVVALAAVDLQGPDIGAFLVMAGLDTPLRVEDAGVVGQRELVLGVAADLVVAGLGVDDGPLDVDGLVE